MLRVYPDFQSQAPCQRFQTALLQAEQRCLARRLRFGSVGFADPGVHRDMEAADFIRSIKAIAQGFASFPQELSDFKSLRRAGKALEAQMFAASGGINTHKGLLFLLCFLFIPYVQGCGPKASQKTIRQLAQGLEADYLCPRQGKAMAHRALRLRDIRQLPLTGFAELWPLIKGPEEDHALSLQLIARCDDSTTLKSGGLAALREVQARARAAQNVADARALNAYYMKEKLRSGGVADLFTVVHCMRLLWPKS